MFAPLTAKSSANKMTTENPSLCGTRQLPGALQAKLTVGAVNDPLEREADRVAAHVMRMPSAAPSLTSAPAQVRKKCSACESEQKEEEEKKIRRQPAISAMTGGDGFAAPPS